MADSETLQQVPSGIKSFALSQFATIQDYTNKLSDLQNKYAKFKFYNRGISTVGSYPLYAIVVGDSTKPAFFLEANLHGRHEWRPTHVILKFIEDMLKENTPFSYSLLQNYCIVAIPMCNPYGYFNNTSHNGHKYSDGVNPEYQGVNLNRQFNYHWADCPQLPADFWTNPAYDFMRPDATPYTGWEQLYMAKGLSAESENEITVIKTEIDRYTTRAYIALHCMDANPYYSATNYNLETWHGPSFTTDIDSVLRNTVIPNVNARQVQNSSLGTINGGVPGADALPQSYIWVQEVKNIPAFVFEFGISYSWEFFTDTYMEMLYQSIYALR